MTRDQAVAQVIIWAAILGTPALILLALAWARAREIIAACQCDTGREPTPAERPYVRGIPQADRYPDDAACGPCACGPCALHADREADWQSWEREVRG